MSKNTSAKYYQNNKERFKKKAPERYQSLSKEEKEKKQQYGRERCKNLTKDEKQNIYLEVKNLLEKANLNKNLL